MKSARVKPSTLLDAAAESILLPSSGKISPGIKTPCGQAAKSQALVDLYHRGVEAGASFDDIEKAMRAAKGCPSGMILRPSNSPAFRVVQDTFETPGAAETIMERYAEQRDGDAIPMLYTFPVVFGSDNYDQIFVEQFEHWNGSQALHWSAPGPDGDLVCQQYAEPNPQSKRGKQFGGRTIETIGPCEPNECEHFLAGGCAHQGILSFYIDGIGGAAPLTMKFQSLYASMGIIETLDLVTRGLGRISGLYRGEPIFWVSKILKNISRMDWATGKPTRVNQWLIRLSTPTLSMVDLMRDAEARKPRALTQAVPHVAIEHQVAEVSADEDTTAGSDTCIGRLVDDPEGDAATKPADAEPMDSATTDHGADAAIHGDAKPTTEASASRTTAAAASEGAIPADHQAQEDPAVTPTKAEDPAVTPTKAEDPAVTPTKAQAKLSVEVTKMRKTLGQYLKRLQWTKEDLEDYLAGNQYALTDVHDATALKRLLAELKPIAEAL